MLSVCFRYYAHVYVKTDTDVQNIVKGLNNLKLNGHTLVVNSIDKILEEATDSEKVKELAK